LRNSEAIDRSNRRKLGQYMKDRFRWPDGGGAWREYPTKGDSKTAAKLDPRVLKAAVAFIRKMPLHSTLGPGMKQEYLPEKYLSVARISAARAVHGLLLLDVNFPILKDGNRNLIYSPASHKIIGRFV